MISLIFNAIEMDKNYEQFYLALAVDANNPTQVMCLAVRKDKTIKRDDEGRYIIPRDQIIASLQAIHTGQDFGHFGENVKKYLSLFAALEKFKSSAKHYDIAFFN